MVTGIKTYVIMYINKQNEVVLSSSKIGWLAVNGKMHRKVYVIIYNNEGRFFPETVTGGLWRAIWMKCFANVEEIYIIKRHEGRGFLPPLTFLDLFKMSTLVSPCCLAWRSLRINEDWTEPGKQKSRLRWANARDLRSPASKFIQEIQERFSAQKSTVSLFSIHTHQTHSHPHVTLNSSPLPLAEKNGQNELENSMFYML